MIAKGPRTLWLGLFVFKGCLQEKDCRLNICYKKNHQGTASGIFEINVVTA
jgi:hypothetical protein